MERIRRNGAKKTMCLKEFSNEALDGSCGHKDSAAAIASLPLHPVAFLRPDNAFSFTGHRLAVLLAGCKKVRLLRGSVPQVVMKVNVAEFVGQRRAETIFSSGVVGKKPGNADARLFSGPEFGEAFDILPKSGEIGIKIEVGGVGLDQLGEVVGCYGIIHSSVKLA